MCFKMQLNKNDKQQHVSVYVTKLFFAKLEKKMYYVNFIKSTFVTYSRWQISYSTNEEEETVCSVYGKCSDDVT